MKAKRRGVGSMITAAQIREALNLQGPRATRAQHLHSQETLKEARALMARHLRDNGWPLKAIALALGCSTERARQLDVYACDWKFDRAPRPHPMLREPLGKLGLNVRAENCLRAAGINTVGELLAHTQHEIWELPNVNHVVLRHILECLANQRLQLRPYA
jgi:hypothetical protein